jgi:hypothetical protein
VVSESRIQNIDIYKINQNSCRPKGKYFVKDFFNIPLKVFTSYEGRGRYSS